MHGLELVVAIVSEGHEIDAHQPDDKCEVGVEGVRKEEQDRGRRDERNADADDAVKLGWA
jgi:hypothetical protein